MLPASDLTEIITNLAGLKPEHQTTMAVLGAVLAPLLRSSQPEVQVPAEALPPARTRKKARSRHERPQEARDKARAALAAVTVD
jgi:hypothetical protein